MAPNQPNIIKIPDVSITVTASDAVQAPLLCLNDNVRQAQSLQLLDHSCHVNHTMDKIM